MLILEQYGVRLSRLTEADIELVRKWRNSAAVANNMHYREPISASQQKAWFASINNKYNYYFLIEYAGKKVGVINAKNYSADEKFGEGGIFIGEPGYEGSFAAVFASLCLLNFVYHHLKHIKKSTAHVLRTNLQAIEYNKAIGYKLLPGQENAENQLYEMDMEDYIIASEGLNRAATLLNKGDSTLKISGTVCPENMDEINALLV